MPFVGWRGVNRRMSHRGVNRLMPHSVYYFWAKLLRNIMWVWGAHSGIAEDSGIQGVLFRVDRWTATDVSLGSGAFEPSDVANDLIVHIQEDATLPLTNVSITVYFTPLNVSAMSQRHSRLSRLRRRQWNPDVNRSILINTNLVLRLLPLRLFAEIISLLNFRSPIFGITPFGWLYYTGCHRRNGPNFGRVFLMLNYTDITQNTYIKSWTVSEIMASEVWNFDSCYTLTDYQIHIETGRNMWFL